MLTERRGERPAGPTRHEIGSPEAEDLHDVAGSESCNLDGVDAVSDIGTTQVRLPTAIESPAGSVALWEAPAWTKESIASGEAVEHSYRVGRIQPGDGDAPFSVEIIQRDEITFDDGRVCVSRGRPSISLAGERLSDCEASELARLLQDAVAIIAQT